MFYSLLNEMDSLAFKVINTDHPLPKKVKNEIEEKYKLDVVSQSDIVIVAGSEANIRSF